MKSSIYGPTSVTGLVLALASGTTAILTLEQLQKMSSAGLPEVGALMWLAAGIYATWLLLRALWTTLLH